MHIVKKILLFSFVLITFNSSAQYLQPYRYNHNSFTQQVNIGVGTARTTAASAYLEVGPTSSANKGFLLPRLSTTERDAIASPATGLEIYNKTTNQVNFYNGSGWVAIDYNSSLQKTTDVGNVTTNNIGIGFSGTPISLIDIQKNNIAESPTDSTGILLENTTAAVNGTQQYSPSIVWRGNGYKTSSGGASRDVRWRAEVVPQQGLSSPASEWRLMSSINGASYKTKMRVTSAGGIWAYFDSSQVNGYGQINGVSFYLDDVTGVYHIGSSGSFGIGSGLLAVTTGVSNNSLGAGALDNVTSGSYNTAIGGNAGAHITDGVLNTAVGYYSLQANTSGYSNTAIGVNAARDHTTGHQNTMVGGGSGELTTIGYENTFLGYDAGLNNTVGARNTYVGWNAKGGAYGLHNIAVGYYNGNALTNDSATASEGNVIVGPYGASDLSIGTQTASVKRTIGIGYGVSTWRDSIAVLGANFIKETILRGNITDSTLKSANGGRMVTYNSTTGEITHTDVGLAKVAYKTQADSTSNTASFDNIPQLTYAFEANSKYEVEVMIVDSSSASGGANYSVDYSAAGASVLGSAWGNTTGGTGFRMGVISNFNTAIGSPFTSNQVTSFNVLMKMMVTTGANAGNFYVQYQKVTSGYIKVYQNSYIKVTRVL